MAGLPRKPTERQSDIELLEALKEQPLVLDSEELSILLRSEERIAGTVGVYQSLARFTIDALYQQHNLSEATHPRIWRVGRTGIQIGRRIIASAPEDYAAFVKEAKTEPNLETLRHSLLMSGTISKILHLPNETAEEVEKALGVFEDGRPLRTGTFEFVDTPRGLVYRDSGTVVRDIALNPTFTSNLPAEMQRCPAASLAVNQVWPGMVNLAIDTPEVVPAHLRVLL